MGRTLGHVDLWPPRDITFPWMDNRKASRVNKPTFSGWQTQTIQAGVNQLFVTQRWRKDLQTRIQTTPPGPIFIATQTRRSLFGVFSWITHCGWNNKLIAARRAKPPLFTAHLWLCDVDVNQQSSFCVSFFLWSYCCCVCPFSLF